MFLGYALYAGRISKGDVMVADIEELEEMDASELHARRLNAKEVLTSQRSGNFIFPVADGSQNLWGRKWSVNIHLNPGSSGTRRRTRNSCKENQMNYNLQPHIKTTQRGMMRKRKVTIQSQTVRAERRIISYAIEVHRRYQNNTYITRRNVGKTD